MTPHWPDIRRLYPSVRETGAASTCPHGTPPPSPKPSASPSPVPTSAPTPVPTSAPTSTPGSGVTFLGGPCYAYAKNGAGGVDTTLTNGEIQVGTYYYTAASDGCLNVATSPTGPFAPATSSQVGIIAYQPGDTSTTTPTYLAQAQNCPGVASLGLSYPGNAGPKILVPVIPGSTGGSCSVTISDGSTSAPMPDAGLVNVGVVGNGPCAQPGALCYVINSALLDVLGCGSSGCPPNQNPPDSQTTSVFISNNNGSTWTAFGSYNNLYAVACKLHGVAPNDSTTCLTYSKTSMSITSPSLSVWWPGLTPPAADAAAFQSLINAVLSSQYQGNIPCNTTTTGILWGTNGPPPGFAGATGMTCLPAP